MWPLIHNFEVWNKTKDPIELYGPDDWDNSLPTLIYHGSSQTCSDKMIVELVSQIQEFGKIQNNTKIDADCISVGNYNTKV